MLVWWGLFYMFGALAVPSITTLVIIQSVILVLYFLSCRRSWSRASGYSCSNSFIISRKNRFFLISITSIVFLIGGIESNKAWVVKQNNRAFDSIQHKSGNGCNLEKDTLKPLNSLRELLLEQLSGKPLSVKSRNMLRALILSDRKGVSYRLKDNYRYLGISHFLALSGLHLGLIVIPLSVLLMLSGIAKRWKELIVLFFVLSYTALADFPPSLMRASALYFAISLYRVINIRANLTNSLISGSFLILLFDREIIFNVGFQLSFLAVAAIASLGIPVIERIKIIIPGNNSGRIIKFIIASAVITISVNLFTLPLILSLFKRSPVVSPLANLLMVLPITLFLYAGFIYLVIPVNIIRNIISVPINFLCEVLCRAPRVLAGHYYPAIFQNDIEMKSYGASVVLIFLCAAAGLKKKGYFIKICAAVLVVFSIIHGQVSKTRQVQIKRNKENSSTRKWWWNGNRYYQDGDGMITIEGGMGRYEAQRIINDLYESGRGKISTLVILSSDLWKISGVVHLIRRLGVERIICSKYLLISERDRFNQYSVDPEKFETVARGDVLKLNEAKMEVISPGLISRGENIRSEDTVLR
ncbi:MAG TPA: ComEC/Rec2 family competence protein, partial [Candidatus Krumholzibacteriaceae bacterium]|nr:ComEC/Rec2 family competence protein [Candidatus Krumholzibacteriaceae bacterium]